MTPRADHIASAPQPDGSVLLKTTDGEDHVHAFTNDNNWMQEPFGVVFHEPKAPKGRPERVVFPWTNIVHFEVYPNSPAYHQLMLQWLKDCDHDWLTHPQVGHYCRVCRIPMSSIEELYSDEFTEAPSLVNDDPKIDRAAAKHEGNPDEPLPAPAVIDAGLGAIAVTLAVMGDPADFCECNDDTTPHDGPCRQNPMTWPTAIVDENEEGNGQF